MLLLFLTVIYSCIMYVGQKPTKACVVLLFKYADYTVVKELRSEMLCHLPVQVK
jgi:hypothetical protein